MVGDCFLVIDFFIEKLDDEKIKLVIFCFYNVFGLDINLKILGEYLLVIFSESLFVGLLIFSRWYCLGKLWKLWIWSFVGGSFVGLVL